MGPGVFSRRVPPVGPPWVWGPVRFGFLSPLRGGELGPGLQGPAGPGAGPTRSRGGGGGGFEGKL